MESVTPLSMTNGCSSTRRIFSATTTASSAFRASGRRMTNSSPPIREAVSDSRRTDPIRDATWANNQSPASCPCWSLTALNLSRSINSNDSLRSSRLASAISCPSRSSIIRRFGKPVIRSWKASLRMASSATLRSVMSMAMPIIAGRPLRDIPDPYTARSNNVPSFLQAWYSLARPSILPSGRKRFCKLASSRS
ncbi:hypothetical protein D3C84_421290 [compost metagenome]